MTTRPGVRPRYHLTPTLNTGVALAHRLAGLYAEAAGRAGKTDELAEFSQRLRPEHHAVCALMQEALDRPEQSAA